MTNQSIPSSSFHRYVRTMEFGVLGPLEVVGDGQRHALGGPKQRAVLALLVARAGGQVSTDSLIEALYGEVAPDRAHRSVHTYISNLRGELGDVIERHGDGYALSVDRSQVDAIRFEDLVQEGVAEEEPSRAGELFREALGLWRGHPYADVEAHTLLEPEIARLNELRISALEARVDVDLESGRDRELIAELDSLTAEYPLHERFRGQQMLALYRSGRQGEALRAYERTRRYLVDEMGLDPSAELRDLEQRILDQDAALLLSLRPTVQHAAVLVADVARPDDLASLAPQERIGVISRQSVAIDQAVIAASGQIFAQRGSAVYAWFGEPAAAAEAAIRIQKTTTDIEPRLRIAIAAGDLEVSGPDEVAGPPVSRAAALVAVAHGAQVLLSADTQESVAASGEPGYSIRSLGVHDIAGLSDGELVYQLAVEGEVDWFPSLRVGERPPALPMSERGLPGYELREEVGTGAFGAVHRAYQPSVGREVAIKIIHPEYANDPGFIRRFEVEAQLVARLEHPKIVPLHDYWRGPEGAFLVMRWLRGGSLADRLGQGRMSIDEATELVNDLGVALDYAHRSGVAHRDLVPSNILFDDEGNVYLSDFGIARPADGGEDFIRRDVGDLARLVDQCLENTDLVDDVLTRATSAAGYGTVVELLEAWQSAVGETGHSAIAFTRVRNPYKGLSAFGELDAADFHGRDDEIDQLVEAVGRRNLVAVVGPSGIGKSSVVRAGLTPALRAGALPGSEEWLIADMMPGAHPFEELATALHRVATEAGVDIEQELRRDSRGLIRAARRAMPDGLHLMVVVDQFEELFTLVEDEVVQAEFLELLMAAIADERANISVVLTMRADFFDRPLRFGDFGDILRSATVPIAAPTETDLRSIINEPAAAVGVTFDQVLVERMVGDVKDQPGALPLLEFSLTELFDGRDSDLLDAATYETAGGVQGALGRRAEAVYGSLDDTEQERARQIFLRLLTLPDAERVTRRRVRKTELYRLGEDQAAIEGVLDAFGSHRLLTTDRDPLTHGPTVEVAHEAIFSEWVRLEQWIEERRSDLRARRRLLEAADEWEDSGRQEELLLTGSRLGQLEAFAAGTDLSLGDAEHGLLESSTGKRDADRARRRRTTRRVLAGFAAAAVVASGLAVAAVLQGSRASDARAEAEVRELAALSVNKLDVNAEQATLLAMEAVREAQESGSGILEATTALHSALGANRVLDRYEAANGFVAASIDGRQIATATAAGSVVIWDLGSGAAVASYERPDATPVGAKFSPDGHSLAVFYAAERDPIWLWDLVTDAPSPMAAEMDTTGGGGPAEIFFDDSGARIGRELFGEFPVWSTTTGLIESSPAAAGMGTFVPGTEHILIADYENNTMREVDLTTGAVVNEFVVDGVPLEFSVSPDGSYVVVAFTQTVAVAAYDLASGMALWETTVDRPAGFGWMNDGATVVVGSDGGRVTQIDTSTGGVSAVLNGGHGGNVRSLAPISGTTLLATASPNDSTAAIWETSPGPVPEVDRLDMDVETVRYAVFAPTTDRLFVSGHNDQPIARVRDLGTGDIVVDIDSPTVGVSNGIETRVGPFGNASLMMVHTANGETSVRDVVSGDIVYPAPAGFVVRAVSTDGAKVLISPHTSDNALPGDYQIVVMATGEVVTSLDLPSPPHHLWLPYFSADDSLIIEWGGPTFSVIDGSFVTDLSDTQSTKLLPDGSAMSIIDREGTMWLVDRDRIIETGSLAESAVWSTPAAQGNIVPPGHIISQDGALITTVTRADEAAKVWDVATGDQIAELDPDLTSGVPYIFFHPDVPHITLAGAGGSLYTYTLDTDELLAIAEDRVTRTLTEAECQTFLHLAQCPVR